MCLGVCVGVCLGAKRRAPRKYVAGVLFLSLLALVMPVNFRSMMLRDSERLTADAAAAGAGVKRGYVKQMFSDIAPHYDRVNRIISFHIDQWWRRKAISALAIRRDPGGQYLDLCAGTLDVAAHIARHRHFRGRVMAADFAEPMLRAGLRKVWRAPVDPVVADALALPFVSEFASGAIVAFGIRNVVDLDAALREVYRVLRPDARFVILELGATQNPLVGWLYRLYFNHLCPLVGNAVARHHSAYNYLPKSVQHFPNESELAARMRDAGFKDVSWRSFTFGVVALHVGEKR